MNWAIVFSVVRAVAPSLLSFIAGRYPQFAGPIMEVAALLGTSGAATWGAMTHTDSAKIAAVAALPDVAKIVAVPSPDRNSAVAAAVADQEQPKVTNSIGVSGNALGVSSSFAPPR